MSVRTRLLLSMGALAAVLVLPALYGLNQLREVERIANSLEGKHAAAQVALGNLQRQLNRADRLQREYVALGEPSTRRELEDVIGTTGAAVARLRWAGYDEGARRLRAGLQEVHARASELYDLVEAGETQEATARFDRFVSALSAVRTTGRSVAAEIDRRSTAAASRAGRIAGRATLTTALGVAGGLLLAIVLGRVTTRTITAPLGRLREATESVAEGKFRAGEDLAVERDDELGAVSRAFETMQERLDDLNELRAELLGASSHRLKTPISVMLGYTEMLADSASDRLEEQERAYLSAIDGQLEELRERVDRLLKLSRVEAGQLDVALEPVPTRPLFDELRRTFEPLAHQQKIDFSVEVADDVPETVRADPDRLRVEVVGNLLENAFRATEAGGEVRVRVGGGGAPGDGNPEAPATDGDGDSEDEGGEGEPEGRNERWSIVVSDTGTGIPSEELDRIFDRYYQVGRENEGVGLGLAMARSVVEAHGGTIRAESEPGRGSTFRVTMAVS